FRREAKKIRPLFDALEGSSGRSTDPQTMAALESEAVGCFAAALLLPQKEFLHDVQATKIDVPFLARIYRTSIETVARRVFSLSRLRRDRLPPMHYLKCDLGGNLITKLQN